MHVTLRKISEAPAARFRAANWAGFTPGQPGKGDESLPIAYELEGELLAPLALGQPIRIRRTSRNGVRIEGDFTSSPVQEIGDGWVRTENSIYRVQTWL